MIARGSARLEAVLRRAGVDPEFRADLLARRAAAARAAGFELTAAERAILENVGGEQLAATIASLPPSREPALAPAAMEATLGIRPDLPPDLASQGIRPDLPPDARADELDPVRGNRPDFDKVKGTLPGLPVAIAVGAVLAGGAAFTVCATAGVRPDVPRSTPAARVFPPATAPTTPPPAPAPATPPPASAPATTPPPASAPAPDAGTDPSTRR